MIYYRLVIELRHNECDEMIRLLGLGEEEEALQAMLEWNCNESEVYSVSLPCSKYDDRIWIRDYLIVINLEREQISLHEKVEVSDTEANRWFGGDKVLKGEVRYAHYK